MTVLRSRDNPKVKRWARLARDGRYRRKEGRALIEGLHLVAAALQKKIRIFALLVVEDEFSNPEIRTLAGNSPILLSKSLFRTIVDAENLPGIAAEIAIPSATQDLKTAEACVFLDAIQDTGNVGTILRSAAAFGIRNAVLGQGCADAWSPKVLRAGMGAHFVMAIQENTDLGAAIESFGGKLACTVPHGGVALSDADLSGRIGWLLGAEGQGVNEALAACATLKVTIPMPGGAESLNVAAAAAICFYQSSLSYLPPRTAPP